LRNLQDIILSLLIFALLCLQNCATTGVSGKRSSAQYRADILKYKSLVKQNPNDATGYIELSVISLELGNMSMAKKLIARAYQLDQTNPKMLFYLGQIFEKLNQKKNAVKFYKQYRQVPLTSPYRRQMSMRYEVLNREIIQSELQQMLAQEANLNIADIPPKSVAVFPFSYQGQDQTYAALGTGIGEMMITDLGQVNGLKVIERIRLQAMMNEMSLSQSGLVDESTAPRFGKLLGAAKIVHGNYDVVKKNNVQFEVGFWDVTKNYFPPLTSQRDVMSNLFKLEKDLVFSLISDLGFELSAQEKIKIQQIPTKNLQAFLSYCTGLEMENSGQFNEAATAFQKAIQIDPTFKNANEKIESNQSLAAASQSGQLDAALVSLASRIAPATTKTDLVNNRLTNISASIGTIFIPGPDRRESAQEASHSGVEVLGDLPLPPAPPIIK